MGGRSTPVVMNGRFYANGPVGEGEGRQERVFCLDAKTGRTIWEQRFNVFLTTIVENRVGWTSVVGDPETGNVYCHGTGGELICFDGGDGRIVWKRSLTEEFGRISGYGGRIHSPLIDEDRLILAFSNSSWGPHNKPLHRIAVFDKRTGELLWWAGPGDVPEDKTQYADPVIAVINGVRMMIFANGEGNVYGMKARTGEMLWSVRLSKRGLNITPVVNGNHVIVAHSEENHGTNQLGGVFCIDATGRGDITDTGIVWKQLGCQVGYSAPAVAHGRVYAVANSAMLHCFDAASGKPYWEFNLGRVGKGSPVVTADKVIYVGEQNGIFHILRDEGDRCVSLDRDEFDREDDNVVEIFGSPAVADGRVYFMTRYHAYCLGAADQPAIAVATLPMPTEANTMQASPTFAYVTPGEITVAPGERVRFDARFLTDQMPTPMPVSPTWSLLGVKGDISADGGFTAATKPEISAGFVVAKGAGLEARARVRVVPKIPFEVDFESLPVDQPPAGWGGIGAKTKVIHRDGGNVLMKLAERPSVPFIRITGYAGLGQSGGYTVQADLLGGSVRLGRRVLVPDMGLVNSRYRFFAGLRPGEGAEQERILRIESWAALPRLRHDVLFDWEPEQWYTAKFRVDVQGGKSLCRAKFWKRGEAEPADWTIEVVDPYPNTEGSPGIYGFSRGTTAGRNGTEIFYDNLKVMGNE
jgi:outer membrane protein assembly factor BamB